EQLFLNYCNNTERKPPFHLAAFLGHLEIGQWLVEIQPSLIHSQNDRGETPLDIIEGNTEFSEWLTSRECKRQEGSCVLM
ncbi:MAG: hypothetical protein ACXWM2_04675, partial [Parachlamydiaceae bacterium]